MSSFFSLSYSVSGKLGSSSLKILMPILLPLTIGLVLLAEPVIRILLERGAFKSEDTLRTASVLRIFAFTMFAANISQLQTRVFYARQKPRITAFVSGGQMVLNILCILILVGPLQYRGLALATSISGMAALIAYQVLIRRDLGAITIYTKPEWFKLLLANLALTIIVLLGRTFLPLMSSTYLACLVSLVGLVGISVIVYAGMLVVLKAEVAGMAIGMIKGLMQTKSKKDTESVM